MALLTWVLLTLLGLAPAQALQESASWTVQDSAGGRWGVSLFRQTDPAYPQAWRLRLNALGPAASLDHGRPLLLDDGQSGRWSLANRSEELVPPGRRDLPSGSAQFDADRLRPAPRSYLPLRLQVPLQPGQEERVAPVTLLLGPEPVEALRSIASPAAPPGR